MILLKKRFHFEFSLYLLFIQDMCEKGDYGGRTTSPFLEHIYYTMQILIMKDKRHCHETFFDI